MSNNTTISIVSFIQILLEIFRFLLSKFLLLFLTAVILGILGVVYAWTKKPLYVSEISFVTESESNQLKGYAGIAAQFGFDLGSSSNGAFDGDNLIEFLKSKKNIINTLLSEAPNSKELFIDLYIKNHKIDLKDEKLLSNGVVSFSKAKTQNTRLEDSLLNDIAEDIIKSELFIARRDKKLNFIDIKYKSGNEFFSKSFSEILIKSTVASYTDYKIRKVKQNVDILQKQTDSVRRILTGNVESVNSIADLNVNPAKQKLRTPIQNKQIDLQVNSALYTELLKNLEISKLSLRKETPLIQVVDFSDYPLFREKPGRFKTGLLFAITGVISISIFLIMRRWYKNQINRTATDV